MELNGLVLVRERTIKLFNDDLTLTYDPLAVKVSELQSMKWGELVARVVKSWNLTVGGATVPLNAEELRDACDSAPVGAVVNEIGQALYQDLLTFPKAILTAPRATQPNATTAATSSAAV